MNHFLYLLKTPGKTKNKQNNSTDRFPSKPTGEDKPYSFQQMDVLWGDFPPLSFLVQRSPLPSLRLLTDSPGGILERPELVVHLLVAAAVGPRGSRLEYRWVRRTLLQIPGTFVQLVSCRPSTKKEVLTKKQKTKRVSQKWPEKGGYFE